MHEPLKEQFSGCLIGQCLGDACGFPVEGAPAAVCRQYVDEYLSSARVPEVSHGIFPFGQNTDDSQLARGVPWQEAGTPSPSAGNGSAMRAGPIGLLFFDDPDGLVRAAVDQGRITHQDPRCSAGGVAVAGAHVGLESIPENFARRVTDQGTWNFNQLVELAHECFAIRIQQLRLKPTDNEPY